MAPRCSWLAALLLAACVQSGEDVPWAATATAAAGSSTGGSDETTWDIESTDPSVPVTGDNETSSGAGESSSGEGGSSTGTMPTTEIGPASGTLLLHGGGSFGDGFSEFIDLAGGPDAAIVLVPTAQPDGNDDVDDPDGYGAQMASTWGLSDVTVVHTRDPAEADTEAFAGPIEVADGVWFGGGRQWRIADAYLGTRSEEAFMAVLDRGGVVGGSSAGASIQGSFLVRGDTAGNTTVIGDHIVGFPMLRGVGIDQHIAERDREYDLFEVLDHDNSLLGIGLDEGTYIVVTGDTFDVHGPGQVYVHDFANWGDAATDDDRILFLQAGAAFDLAARSVL